MSSEEPILSDEQILEFEQQIKDEEAQKVQFKKKTRNKLIRTFVCVCAFFRFHLYAKTSLSINLKKNSKRTNPFYLKLK